MAVIVYLKGGHVSEVGGCHSREVIIFVDYDTADAKPEDIRRDPDGRPCLVYRPRAELRPGAVAHFVRILEGEGKTK